jgi:hypothetical protein
MRFAVPSIASAPLPVQVLTLPPPSGILFPTCVALSHFKMNVKYSDTFYYNVVLLCGASSIQWHVHRDFNRTYPLGF